MTALIMTLLKYLLQVHLQIQDHLLRLHRVHHLPHQVDLLQILIHDLLPLLNLKRKNKIKKARKLKTPNQKKQRNPRKVNFLNWKHKTIHIDVCLSLSFQAEKKPKRNSKSRSRSSKSGDRKKHSNRSEKSFRS